MAGQEWMNVAAGLLSLEKRNGGGGRDGDSAHHDQHALTYEVARIAEKKHLQRASCGRDNTKDAGHTHFGTPLGQMPSRP